MPRKKRAPVRPRTEKKPKKGTPDIARRLKLRELELEIISKFSQTFWATLDHRVFSQHLYQMLKRRMDIHGLLLFLVDDLDRRLIVASHRRISDATKDNIRNHVARKLADHLDREVQPQSVKMVHHRVSTSGKAPGTLTASPHIHTVPLAVLDRVHGLLGMVFPLRRSMTREDSQFLNIVAGEVAMVAENQRIQQTLARERNLLVSILHSMTCAVLVVDQEQRIVLSNPLADAIFGLRAERVAGVPLKDVIRSEPIVSLFQAASQLASEYLSREVEIQNVSQGRNMTARANLAKVHNAGGHVVGVVMVLNDVTREKEMENVRSEFVSVTSHELRTPMAAIREAVSLILDGITGPVNDKQRKFLDMARRNIDRLTAIINDLLDLSKIEAGKLTLQLSPMDPSQIVEDVFATFEPTAAEKGISLLKKVESRLPKINVDHDKIAQVLGNLVSNAIKFTAKGGMVTIAAQAGHERQKGVEFYVQDTGIGIERKDFGKLFKKFQQIDSSLSRVAGGTGLGLAISKEITELHAGRIWAESEPGRGSTFHVLLPVNPQEIVKKRYVLAVTSDREQEDLIRTSLKGEKFEVGGVCRGGEVGPTIQGLRPDLILLDSRIPDMDVFELCHQLRDDPQTSLIPVVLLTSAEQESAVWKALSLGVQGYLVRPLDSNAILSTVREVIP